jgi:hypothetical protein
MLFNSFGERMQADMEVALERACDRLPRGTDSHEIRREVALAIMSAANSGSSTLTKLTYAAEKALKELCLTRGIHMKQSA